MEVKCDCCGKDGAVPRYVAAGIPINTAEYDTISVNLCKKCIAEISKDRINICCKDAQQVIDHQIAKIRKRKIKKLLS